MLMKIAHPKTNIRRTFLEKLCFDFMADNVTIELVFGQQVAAEPVKNIPKGAKRVFLRCAFRAGEPPYGNLTGRKCCKSRHMKRESIGARNLVRPRAIHLCLDSKILLSDEINDALHLKRFIGRADDSLTEFVSNGAIAAQMIGTPVADSSRACAEVGDCRVFSVLAFRVDIASELLPKRSGRRGLGQAKRRPTVNRPH
jgi:hypothetical protein